MEVRGRILEKAARLFASKGVEGTSLQEISDAVGVRKPSVLHHFPSKEALHAGVLRDVLARWMESVPRLLRAATRVPGGDGAPEVQRFDALLGETLVFFAEDPDRARLLLREALDRPAALKELLREHAAPWLGVVRDAFRRAQAAGTVRANLDPEAYLFAIVHLIVGTFAAGPVLHALLPAGERGMDRFTAELRRMARVSLVRSAPNRAGKGATAR